MKQEKEEGIFNPEKYYIDNYNNKLSLEDKAI